MSKWLGASYGGASPKRVTRIVAPSAFAVLDAVLAAPVDDGHQAHDATVALLPAPREGGESDALAGDLVDVAADVLDAADAGGEDRRVARLPIREVLDHLAAGFALVFQVDLRQ